LPGQACLLQPCLVKPCLVTPCLVETRLTAAVLASRADEAAACACPAVNCPSAAAARGLGQQRIRVQDVDLDVLRKMRNATLMDPVGPAASSERRNTVSPTS
jgi:hypothetical protein